MSYFLLDTFNETNDDQVAVLSAAVINVKVLFPPVMVYDIVVLLDPAIINVIAAIVNAVIIVPQTVTPDAAVINVTATIPLQISNTGLQTVFPDAAIINVTAQVVVNVNGDILSLNAAQVVVTAAPTNTLYAINPEPAVVSSFASMTPLHLGVLDSASQSLGQFWQVILTGGENGTTDIILPTKSIQVTLRSEGSDQANISVPKAGDHISSILARSDGRLVIQRLVTFDNGSRTISSLVSVPFNQELQRNRGALKDTITFGGLGTPPQLFAPSVRNLQGLGFNQSSGKFKFDTALDVTVRPTDLAIIDGLEFIIATITINIGDGLDKASLRQ